MYWFEGKLVCKTYLEKQYRVLIKIILFASPMTPYYYSVVLPCNKQTHKSQLQVMYYTHRERTANTMLKHNTSIAYVQNHTGNGLLAKLVSLQKLHKAGHCVMMLDIHGWDEFSAIHRELPQVRNN